MKYLLSCILICTASTVALSADEADVAPSALQQFNSAYEILQKADTARDHEDMPTAIRNYQDALGNYKRFFDKYPNWESNVVRFRIMYCNDQLESCIKKQEINASKPIEEQQAIIPETPVTVPAARQVPVVLTKAEIDNAISEGLTHIEKNDPESARKLLLEYLKMAPDNRSIRLACAVAQCKCGNYSDAVSVLESLVSEYPDDTSSRIALASAYLGVGDIDKSKQEITAVIKNSPLTREAYYDMVQICLAAKQPDIAGAALHYKKWLELGGKPDAAVQKLIDAK